MLLHAPTQRHREVAFRIHDGCLNLGDALLVCIEFSFGGLRGGEQLRCCFTECATTSTNGNRLLVRRNVVTLTHGERTSMLAFEALGITPCSIIRRLRCLTRNAELTRLAS